MYDINNMSLESDNFDQVLIQVTTKLYLPLPNQEQKIVLSCNIIEPITSAESFSSNSLLWPELGTRKSRDETQRIHEVRT